MLPSPMLGPRSGHCAPDTLTHTCAHACTPMCGCVHGTHVGTHNLSTHTHGQRPPGPHMHSGAHTYLPPTHMHTHTPICMYTHARTHTCTHTHVHITCIHTHHTNTHTHMLTLTLEHTGIRGLSGHSRCGRRSLLHSPPLPPKAAPKAEHPSPTAFPHSGDIRPNGAPLYPTGPAQACLPGSLCSPIHTCLQMAWLPCCPQQVSFGSTH